MKLSKYICAVLVTGALLGSLVSFADDYPRLDKAYPSGDKIIFVENNKYGIKDNNFFTIVDPVFDYIAPYQGNYAISTFKNKKGIIDNKGKVYISNKYDDIVWLENNNFLGIKFQPGNLQYIFISNTKEDFLLDSYQKYYENGGRITDKFVGTLGDQYMKRKNNPSKLDDLFFANNILRDTNYWIVDNVKDDNFGNLLYKENKNTQYKDYFKLSYSSNLSPVIEINLWGRTLLEEKKEDIIVIENLTYELLKYYTESDYIAGLIFEDINYFMKSGKVGIKFNKTYNNIVVSYNTTEKNGIKFNIRKN